MDRAYGYIDQILVHSHFELVSLLLAQFATKAVTQMIKSAAILFTSNKIGAKAAFVFEITIY